MASPDVLPSKSSLYHKSIDAHFDNQLILLDIILRRDVGLLLITFLQQIFTNTRSKISVMNKIIFD